MLPWESTTARTSRAFSTVAWIFALLRITRVSCSVAADLGRGHRGDLHRVEAVERLPNRAPLGLNDTPDPALEDLLLAMALLFVVRMSWRAARRSESLRGFIVIGFRGE